MKRFGVLSCFLSLAFCHHLHTHDHTFTPDHILRVTREQYSIGCGSSRDSFLVNGTSPGPEIRLRPAKISWIRVYNDVPDSNLTMHWHGLSQRVAPFSDGTPMTSQWPIPPLHFFDYEVFPGELDSGTYFYHSHVGFQAVTATGPLIVEDLHQSPYEYDEEMIVLATDYFNKTDAAVVSGLTGVPFTWSGETAVVLLNGRGVQDAVQASGQACELPTFDLEEGRTYRFRFIGGTALSLTSMKIEEHDGLTVIAADAKYTQPYAIDHVQIGTGQRFDVLIKAKTCEELEELGRDSFYMKFQTKDRPSVYTGFAVFRYNHEQTFMHTPKNVNLTLSNDTYNYLEYALEPLVPNGFPSADEVTRRLTMTVQQEGMASAHIDWFQNGLSWTEGSEQRPLLTDIYLDGEAAIPNYTLALANGGWDPNLKAWPAKIGEVLEIVIQNTGSEVGSSGGLDIHPWHAHAGHYYDIGSGPGKYDPAKNEKRLAGYHPVLRDTTYLYKFNASTGAGQPASWRAWRLRVSDAGAYMVHCHILQHMIMGMQTAWIFGNASEITRIPYEHVAGYLSFGGSAYGNDSIDPLAYHYFRDQKEQPWE